MPERDGKDYGEESPNHTNSGCGKERRTTLSFTGPVPADSRQ